jgi:ATP-dependent DNA helicase RecG
MTTGVVERALTAPPDRIGAELLALPEDQWFDRKSARIAPKDLANVLVGMANAEGGVIAIGLENGRVEGTDSDPKRRNEQMQAPFRLCEPAVRTDAKLVPCLRADGASDHLLVLDVEPSEGVHANQRDEVYLRVGDETRRLTFQQRTELLYDKGDASYETRRVAHARRSDIDESLLQNYVIALGASDGDRLLAARGLAKDSYLTVAGCLLFARQPQTFLPEALVRVLRYRGRERGTGSRQQLLEDVRIEGPIPAQLMKAREEIKRLQPARRALASSGRFENVPLVPEDAWLEGLVNAVVHRSYSVAGDHIRIEIFDDRIEISSPGRFPGLVDLTDPIRATRFARNPRIARVCADLHFGQELGEGIKRMYEEMRGAGLGDPAYHQTAGSVQLLLSGEPIDRELAARLPEHARAIVTALRRAERLSTGEITDLLGVSRPVAQRELAVLQDEGVVEWVGKSPKDPRAFWRLAPT